jgi:hypothetical protein
METKEESREERGNNFEMKDFKARNRSCFVKRLPCPQRGRRR